MSVSKNTLEPVALNLILVDEQAESTQRFKEELVNLGYDATVVQIKSRTALLEWLGDHTCDAIVANHRVDDFKAVDVLLVLSELKLDIPVILLSPPEWDPEKGPLLRAGAIGFILPTEVRRIVPMIEDQLRITREVKILKQEFAKGTGRWNTAVPEPETPRDAVPALPTK